MSLTHTWTPQTGPFGDPDQCRVQLSGYPCPYPKEAHKPGPPEDVSAFGQIIQGGMKKIPIYHIVHPDESFAVTIGDTEWVGSHHIVVRRELVTTFGQAMPRRFARAEQFASKVIGPATGLVGEPTLQFLYRQPSLALADSDMPQQFAITNSSGEMVGITAKCTQAGLAVEDLPAWRRVVAALAAEDVPNPVEAAMIAVLAYKGEVAP